MLVTELSCKKQSLVGTRHCKTTRPVHPSAPVIKTLRQHPAEGVGEIQPVRMAGPTRQPEKRHARQGLLVPTCFYQDTIGWTALDVLAIFRLDQSEKTNRRKAFLRCSGGAEIASVEFLFVF